jgi:general stress protein 26
MPGSPDGRPQVGTRDIEDLRGTHLARADQDDLLDAQTECTVAYASREGWPAAVVMSFLRRDGRFWLTAVAGRDHLDSLRADGRLTLVVDNRGTGLPGRRMLAVQGTVVVHEDRRTKDWFSRPSPSAWPPTTRPPSCGCSTARTARCSR